MPVRFKRVGAVNPGLGAPRVGLIFGTFCEVAVEQQVFLIGSGCEVSCGYGGENREQKNCEEPNPNPFPSGKGNRIVGSSLVPQWEGGPDLGADPFPEWEGE